MPLAILHVHSKDSVSRSIAKRNIGAFRVPCVVADDFVSNLQRGFNRGVYGANFCQRDNRTAQHPLVRDLKEFESFESGAFDPSPKTCLNAIRHLGFPSRKVRTKTAIVL
jgi:hypothetical protein